MSEAIYLVLETELDDLQESTEAKSVAQSLKELDRVAAQIGVTALSAFSDGSEDDYQELSGPDGWETHDLASDDGWYEAAEALESVGALHGYVESDPDAFELAEEMTEELQRLRVILDRAAGEGVRFKFEID